MAPSKEAMAAAEKLVFPHDSAGEVGFDTVMCFGRPLYMEDEGPEEVERIAKEFQADVATALDDHTADLRREVEALRARVAEWEAFNKPLIDGWANMSDDWEEMAEQPLS